MSDLSSPAETGEDQTPTPLQALERALDAARDTSHYRWPQQEDLPAILTAVRDAIAAEIERHTRPAPRPGYIENPAHIARRRALRDAAAIARRTV